jgi:ubiquinone/menaquinone biosynthesis C-methylase UbiE
MNGDGITGFYRRHVVSRLIELAMRQKELRPLRERVLSAAEGRVLEIGAGSGLNLPLYPTSSRSVIGIEPAPPLLHLAWRRSRTSPVPVALIQGSAETLPLGDRSVDTVVTTWTLCTIPDVARALAEIRRVLCPGGVLLFVEHGLAPEPNVRRWQARLDPLWSRLSGGCHLNRPIDKLIRDTGFQLDSLRTFRLPGPRTHTFMYEGSAR